MATRGWDLPLPLPARDKKGLRELMVQDMAQKAQELLESKTQLQQLQQRYFWLEEEKGEVAQDLQRAEHQNQVLLEQKEVADHERTELQQQVRREDLF